ncbi:MFS transporter [Virgibacillus halodenitrificans]|uniref:MFS transporter n=1 Tax=Virgibacillus halodenitrificans TaxID=1482 RepID=UPI002DB7D968|nr:MFS transporter [Virgibacillus halodenitrificans]MEC2159101.1 MFS transporter [Virgibacillus halodenitrificans]
MSGEADSIIKKDKLITSILFWCALIVVSSVYTTTPLIDVFSDYFSTTSAHAAWTSSSFSLFYAIGFLFFGPLSDRFGRKNIILTGLLALGILTPLIGMTDQLEWVVALRGIQGFFAATFAPTALAYAFEMFPKQKLVTVIGFLSFGYVTAGIFGQVLAGGINNYLGWQSVFVVFGIFYLITFVVVLLFLPRDYKRIKYSGLKRYLYQITTLFKYKNLVLCYLITFTLLLTFVGMYTVLGNYLGNEPFQLTETEILYIRAFGFIGMLLSPLAGRLVNTFGLIAMLKFGLSLSSLCLVLMGLSSSLFIIIITSILFVGGISLLFPVIMLLIGEFGGEQRALASSLYAFILFIGATAGPLIAVMLMSIGDYIITFTVLSFLLVIGIPTSFFIKYENASYS